MSEYWNPVSTSGALLLARVFAEALQAHAEQRQSAVEDDQHRDKDHQDLGDLLKPAIHRQHVEKQRHDVGNDAHNDDEYHKGNQT